MHTVTASLPTTADTGYIDNVPWKAEGGVDMSCNGAMQITILMSLFLAHIQREQQHPQLVPENDSVPH